MRQDNGEVKIPGACFVVENRAKPSVLGEAALWIIPSLCGNTSLRRPQIFRKAKGVLKPLFHNKGESTETPGTKK